MGQTYQHILVRAAAEDVVEAMLPDDTGYVLPLIDGVSALFMDESAYRLDEEAERLSGALRTDAMTVGVLMSDFLIAHAYQDGVSVNEYHSGPDTVQVTEDADGVLRFADGTVFDPYRDEFPRPEPVGGEPRWFLPYGVPEAEAETVAQVLRCEAPDGSELGAEGQHAYLYIALGLPVLCIGFRHLDDDLLNNPGLEQLFAAALPFGEAEPIVPVEEPETTTEGTEGTSWER
ncbi:hypothetical protein [Yinghuangia soli]|uniref:Uncharacterized protein n=1 Tax=Yinghuangia soli TaxID=2908204 RepID=A0AA41U273_9ACTN|nr:hypothetical protein [Yinghuangia soli]MCF2530401.1 hypothetical protein [Yinghuangia soli]